MGKASDQGDSDLLRGLALRGNQVRAAIELRVLGTAAGGGFPQWNCFCPNCRDARSGILQPRLQSGVAIRASDAWFLVNASPDISVQIASLQPPHVDGSRHSPIAGVLLTNADLDHTLGLFSLREGKKFPVIAPDGVRQALEQGLNLTAAVETYSGVRWSESSFDWQQIPGAGFEVRAVRLIGAEPPRYCNQATGCHGVGYLVREHAHAKVAGIFPDVAAIDPALDQVLATCDLLLFDGTFFDDDEFRRVGVGERTARQMGHIPVSESLDRLAALRIPTCAYIHINNTNPILRPGSPQRRAVEDAGLLVADDGMTFTL